jgi:hypothetical protein
MKWIRMILALAALVMWAAVGAQQLVAGGDSCGAASGSCSCGAANSACRCTSGGGGCSASCEGGGSSVCEPQ